MNPIGIMQGRLSAGGARAQLFPAGTWRDEFHAAGELGFDRIEWLVNVESLDRNPLLHAPDEVREVIRATGIGVQSVCADCFIEQPLARASDHRQSAILLQRVIEGAAAIGAGAVCVPFLEGNAVEHGDELVDVLSQFDEALALARSRDIRIAIETDLDAADLRDAIRRANVWACFDVGNAAAAAVDIAGALAVLADRVALIHVKDRRLRGPSVPLGEGAVDFSAAFATLRTIEYTGPLTLETPRGDSPVESARRHLEFVRHRLTGVTAAA
jgi:hexulose-6-phosphate isomerase